MSTSNYSKSGRLGGLVSWSNTVDRTARTAPARRKSPGSIEYHLDRLPASFADATPKQRQDAAEAARRAHFAKLALASARARSAGGDAA